MPTIIFKRFRTSEKIELEFDNLEGLSVEEVREKVSSSLGLPSEDFVLIYGGRVLKNGRTLSSYFVVAGCTVFVMSRERPKATVDATVRSESTSLLENSQVLSMIARIIGSPGLLQTVLQGTSLGDSSAIRGIVDSPDLMASFSDPDNIQEYIRSNPPVASAMEEFIRQVLGPGFDETDYEEQSLINMLEGFLDDQISVMEEGDDEDDDEEEEEEEVQLALAQEQMFEHSQALQAHYQQQQLEQPQAQLSSAAAGAPLQQESTYNQAASQQHGSLLRPSTETIGGITRQQLASALAAAMDATPTIPVPPQESSRSSASSFGPSHLTVPHGGGSVQAGTLYSVPGGPPNPPHPTPFSSQQASRSSSNPGHALSHAGHAPTGPITPEALQQALSSIAAGNPASSQPPPPPSYYSRSTWSSATNTSGSSTQGGGRQQGGYRHQQEGVQENLSSLAQQYSEQLEQLHRMGIVDDAACLQALAATEGDIMAALEILYTQ